MASETTAEPSEHAASQYTTTSDRLAARLAIHAWNTHSEGWFSWAGSRIPKRGSVLETGAGTGQLWRESPPLAGMTKDLALTDFSPAMCVELRKLANEIKGVKVHVQQASAEELPFDDETFDTVVANHMLYHVDSPDAALGEFWRVLKRDGTVVVALNGMDHLDELLALGDKVGRPSTIRKQARITAETAQEALVRNGFKDVTEERFPGHFEVGDVQPVVDYLSSLGEVGLERGQKEVIEREVGEAMEREGGVFRVTKNMVLFTARKR
ncbi:methyltransferase type 11 [Westerdykella ornata]|uniref:Methyltransferase type 11 n=1 Tax=Westerdykella ornata TaxID=318751 RepID=A0A6A6J4F3_WESOR|nr:methyltransferase type 11 [Westerdykella ornata]KAF2271450.1 methyltransferase type 11 [Westerdykella ornata]